MAYRIDKNPLIEEYERVQESLSDVDLSGVNVFNREEVEGVDIPQAVRDFARHLEDANERASANPPVHEEYHVEDLVTIEISHHQLLNLVYCAQFASVDRLRKMEQIEASAAALGGEIPSEFAGLIMKNMKTAMLDHIEFVNLASSLNTIRLAARPLELPECPHNEGGPKKDTGTLGNFDNIGDLFGEDAE